RVVVLVLILIRDTSHLRQKHHAKRRFRVACQGHPVSVPFRKCLGEQPFSRIDAQPVSLPVIASAIRNFDKLVRHDLVSDVSRARVLLSKALAVVTNPAEDRSNWNSHVTTYRTQSLAFRQPPADFVRSLLRVRHRPPAPALATHQQTSSLAQKKVRPAAAGRTFLNMRSSSNKRASTRLPRMTLRFDYTKMTHKKSMVCQNPLWERIFSRENFFKKGVDNTSS